MQGDPFGALLAGEAALSKFEGSVNSKSQLKNVDVNELFSLLRLCLRWFAGFEDALLKHVVIQDVIVKSMRDWTQAWRLLDTGCSYQLCYG